MSQLHKTVIRALNSDANVCMNILQSFPKTVNTRENLWDVYCFATNQMWDETEIDNGQTTTGISHDLMWNNELALSSARNLQFSLCISLKKKFFLPQTNTSHFIPSVQNTKLLNWPKSECKLWKFTMLQVCVISQLQKITDRKPPITAN